MITDTDQPLQLVPSNKSLKASVFHPEEEQSFFSCFSFLSKAEVTFLLLQTELTSQEFIIPVIIPKLESYVASRETKAGITLYV